MSHAVGWKEKKMLTTNGWDILIRKPQVISHFISEITAIFAIILRVMQDSTRQAESCLRMGIENLFQLRTCSKSSICIICLQAYQFFLSMSACFSDSCAKQWHQTHLPCRNLQQGITAERKKPSYKSCRHWKPVKIYFSFHSFVSKSPNYKTLSELKTIGVSLPKIMMENVGQQLDRDLDRDQTMMAMN